jgi:ATP-dependent Lon protease
MATPDSKQISEAPIPEEIAGTLLVSTVVFPYDVVSVQMNKPRSLRMLEENPGDNVIVGCFFPKEPDADDAQSVDDLLPVGVACRLIHRMRMPNDTVQVVFQGLKRIECLEVLKTDPRFSFRVKEIDPREPRGPEVDGLVYRCMEMVEELIRAEGGYPQEMVEILRMNIAGGGRFADLVGAHVNLPLAIKRKIATTADVRDRLRVVEDVLQEAIGRVRVEADV